MSQPGKSDMVCSGKVTVGDGLKKAEALSAQISEMADCDFGSLDTDVDQLDDTAILHRAAGIIRNATDGITFSSYYYSPSSALKPGECRLFVPDTLCDFIKWCTSRESFNQAERSVTSEAKNDRQRMHSNSMSSVPSTKQGYGVRAILQCHRQLIQSAMDGQHVTEVALSQPCTPRSQLLLSFENLLTVLYR